MTSLKNLHAHDRRYNRYPTLIMMTDSRTSLLSGTVFVKNKWHYKRRHACDLLGAPPLQLLKPSASLDDSFTITETELEDVDFDTSFCYSQEESTTE